MANGNQALSIAMTDEDIRNANKDLIDYQESIVDGNKTGLWKLQKKLSITYWVIIALSVIMFLIGIALLMVPVITAIKGQMEVYKSLVSGGFGIADLAALFFFRPLERIHKLMGDMSQIFLALSSYQTQLGLRLLQMDIKVRATIGDASDKIAKAAEDSIKNIENYFEKAGML